MYFLRSLLVSTVLLAGAAALPAWAQPEGPAIDYAVIHSADAVHPGGEARVALRFTLDEGWHVNAHEPYDAFSTPTVFELTETAGVAVEAIAYPEAEDFEAEFQEDTLAVYGTEFVIGVRLSVAEDTPPGDHTLAGTLTYQACDAVSCAFPTDLDVEITLTVAPPGAAIEPRNKAVFEQIDWADAVRGAADDEPEPPADAPPAEDTAAGWQAYAEDFRVAGRGFGYQNASDFIAFIDRAHEAGATPAEQGDAAATTTQADESGGAWTLAGKSWGVVVLLVLAGGFLLNLTPCVLPLIPINIAIIGAGARAGSRARGFALGGTYGLGIALVYGLLGLVVVLGVSSAFGSLNANPFFNLGITVLFVVLGLAMFDVIQIDFSRYQSKVGVVKNEKGSFFIALFMGSVSALLAGACVAPVVIYTIVYAQDLYNAGSSAALALPFLLGVGMALPWPFAGAGLSFLPKPGIWMVRVKQALGIFILLFAAYYGYETYKGFTAAHASPDAVAQSVMEADEHGWVNNLEAGLEQAAAQNKPVLIDFWATWCKSCLAMNETTLQDDRVLEALSDHVKIKYQAEQPNAPETGAVMEHFGVIGLPTYVVLEPES
ncbi:MAG: thioredoxin family protein [Candidatus Hydrogenedentota bacterium]